MGEVVNLRHLLKAKYFFMKFIFLFVIMNMDDWNVFNKFQFDNRKINEHEWSIFFSTLFMEPSRASKVFHILIYLRFFFNHAPLSSVSHHHLVCQNFMPFFAFQVTCQKSGNQLCWILRCHSLGFLLVSKFFLVSNGNDVKFYYHMM